MHEQDLSSMCDRALITEVTRLAANERRATAQLVAALAELDARRLYLGEGCSSLFTYCTRVLHLSEHAAYSRIEAARAGRRFPVILELLAKGDVNVTAVGLLARLLTDANHRDLLGRAIHKSKREIEEIVAAIRPQSDVAGSVRKLPARLSEGRTPEATSSIESSPVAPAAAPIEPRPRATPSRTVVAPIAPERYKVQLTVSRETHLKLQRVQDLMRHTVPDGDLAAIFDRALTTLLAEFERARIAAATRTQLIGRSDGRSRHIPSAVKRAVWKRDEGQCAFQGARGRCRESGFLEFHHVVPFAVGGKAEESNIQLRCRAHNQYEADLFFGEAPALRERRRVFGAPGYSVQTELGPAERRDQ